MKPILPGSSPVYKRQWDKPEQKTIEQFEAILDKIFSLEVEAIIWEQYTPYFNDGDTCEFTVHEFSASKTTDPWYVIEEYHGLVPVWSGIKYIDSKGRMTTQSTESVYDGYSYGRVDLRVHETRPPHPAADAFKELTKNQYAFEDALYEAFGDHVKVTATKNGYFLEEIEHD